MTTKKTLMAAAFACAVTPVAFGADIIGDDGNPANDLTIEAPLTQVKGDALVNGTLTVQPELSTVVGPTIVTPGSGTPTTLDPIIPGTGGDVKMIETTLDTNEATQTADTSEGFVAETNGNATLNAPSETVTTVDYGRLVTQEVAQAGNINPVGVAIPGTEKYYVTNPVTGTQIQGPFATEALLDAWIDTQTPATLLLLDPTLGMEVTSDGNGGNLQVDGNANVDGLTTLNGLTNTGDTDLNGNVDVEGVLAVDTITDTAGNGLIRRDADGSLHVGNGSFVIDDASVDHVLSSNSGTKIVLGADIGLTVADENKDIEVANALNVIGVTTTNGLTNTGNVTTDSLTVNNNATVGGTLAVTGATTTNGITNTGNIATDTLSTTGLATLNSASVTNDLAVGGNTDLNGNLDVQGATNLQSSLNVDGATTTNGISNTGDITNTGNIATETLNVTKDAIIGRDLKVGRNAQIDGNTNIDGILSLGDQGFGGVNDVAKSINKNADAIAENKSSIKSNKRRIKKNSRGIAMVAAMTNTTVLPGNCSAVDFNLSHFDGETGFGFGYARAINPNLQLKISVASTTDFEESVVRAGVSYQW